MDDATAKQVRRRARFTALTTVVGWHLAGAAVVRWASLADAGQCRGKCGVDEHALDGFIYLGQLTALIVFFVAAGGIALITAGIWRRHPILIGTGCSSGALFIAGYDLWLILST